jgi:hypothetical protein
MIDALKLRLTRLNTRGHNDLIIALGLQGRRIDAGVEPKIDAQKLDAAAIITQGLVELFLARNTARQIELAADFGSGIIDRQLVAALGGFHGIRA